MRRCPVCGTHFRPTNRRLIAKHLYWNGRYWTHCTMAGEHVILCDRNEELCPDIT
jgi:hypothetical protein